MKTTTLAAGAVLLALAACAAPSAGKPDGRLDGAYAGQRTIDPSCGAKSEDFIFYVDGSEISNRAHHKRHLLIGTVGSEGQIAMHDLADRRQIEGSITGTTLTATEPDQHSNKKNRRALVTNDSLGDNCIWRLEATRVPNG